MLASQTPRWIRFLEKKIPWLAIPSIAILIVTLQAIGFAFVMMDPIWWGRFALVPEAVQIGQYWRLVTFLALPLSTSPIWVIFTLWFLYYVVNLIETEWGAFKTTLYVLISILLMISFSLIFNYPILEISGFESTLFLASAALFPEMEVLLFFIVPVKVKWLAWLTMAWVGFRFITADGLEKAYLFTIYLNYILFFGAAIVYQIKQIYRKWDFRSKMKR